MPYKKTSHKISFNDHCLHYTHYKGNNSLREKILFIPGSRLGGIETWEAVIPYLGNYKELIICELRGVGPLSSLHKPDDSFTLQDILDDVYQIISHAAWTTFNLAGYSFGGFIAMLMVQKLGKPTIPKHILIEPAILADVDENMQSLAAQLDLIASLMGTDLEEGNKLFSALVAPKRREFPLFSTSSKGNYQRHIYDPIGFVNLMRILSAAYREIDRWELIANQINGIYVLTEYSPPGTIEMMKQIKAQYPDCHIEFIHKAGHELIFSNPTKISEIINQFILS